MYSKKQPKSDWNYPVDFWRGKNGIDKIAFQYWFGEYDELEKILETIERLTNGLIYQQPIIHLTLSTY